MADNLSIAVHIFPMDMFKLLSVDEILLPGYLKCSFRGLPFNQCGDGVILMKKNDCTLCQGSCTSQQSLVEEEGIIILKGWPGIEITPTELIFHLKKTHFPFINWQFVENNKV